MAIAAAILSAKMENRNKRAASAMIESISLLEPDSPRGSEWLAAQ